MDAISRFTNPGIGFFLTLIFGFWLSHSGKPHNGILFNIHKLIALGTVILTTMQIYNTLKSMEDQALIILLIIITAICVAALFASGAFMSIGNLDYQIMKTIHNVALALGIIAMTVTICLLNGRTL